MLARIFAIFVLFVATSGVRADDAKDAESKLKDYLAAIKGADAARVSPLSADGVKETFPEHTLFAAVFPQFPVARVAPEPLKSANVIAIPKKKGAKPILITDAKELEKFFQENAGPVKSNDDAEKTTEAWLRTASELNQDGFFKFRVKVGSVAKADTAITVDGTSSVDPQNGDKGEIKATLTFKDGKLRTTETKVNLSAGIRPRCQATKLLDPDPIVRAIAEDSLRVLGSAAKPYLDEQRAKASPELRKAIDRVWAKILSEGR